MSRINFNTSLLPPGHHDLLPPHSWILEKKRRVVLDTFYAWSYDLVIPPLVEFPQNIQSMFPNQTIETGNMLVLIDPESGKQIGLRSDMTPQTTRIDAYCMDRPINRLSYFGRVVKPHPSSYSNSRSPIQFGAEIFESERRLCSEIEAIELAGHCLEILGVTSPLHLCLGHAGLIAQLINYASLSEQHLADLLPYINAKDKSEIKNYLEKNAVTNDIVTLFTGLTDMYGDAQILTQAKASYASLSPEISQTLQQLELLSHALHKRNKFAISFDLSEHRGASYENGVTFTFYLPQVGCPVLQGGRYVFGDWRSRNRTRTAVGFSGDMHTICDITQENQTTSHAASTTPSKNISIYVPFSMHPAIDKKVAELRAQGRRVVRQPEGCQPMEEARFCDYSLTWDNGCWNLHITNTT